jgi:hypothetical protein
VIDQQHRTQLEGADRGVVHRAQKEQRGAAEHDTEVVVVCRARRDQQRAVAEQRQIYHVGGDAELRDVGIVEPHGSEKRACAAESTGIWVHEAAGQIRKHAHRCDRIGNPNGGASRRARHVRGEVDEQRTRDE